MQEESVPRVNQWIVRVHRRTRPERNRPSPKVRSVSARGLESEISNIGSKLRWEAGGGGSELELGIRGFS